MAKIWMCEDMANPFGRRTHKFAETKDQAELRMAIEYGWKADEFCLCRDTGCAKDAVEIDVPEPVADTLLAAMLS